MRAFHSLPLFLIPIVLISRTASCKDEPAPAQKPSEIRVLDNDGRVLLSRGGIALAVLQARACAENTAPVLAAGQIAKMISDRAPLAAGREDLRQFRLTAGSASAEILLRAKRVSTGARLLFAGAGGDSPRPAQQAFPKLELAIQILPDADGKTPDIFYADGERISPDGLTQRRARSWSIESLKGSRVSIARSSGADWRIERLDQSLILTAPLLPDPRERLEAGSFILYLGSGADEGAPELSPLKLDKLETPARDFIEGAVRVYASGANPYVLSEAAVVAEVACPARPDGEVPIKRLPCFFWEAPPGSPAEGEFRFRFAPPAEGVYAVRIAAVTGAGQVRGEAVPFRAGPPATPGSARVRAGERFFRLDEGSLYQPIAVELPPPENKADVKHFRDLFVKLAREGINAARLSLYSEKLRFEGPRAGEFDCEVAAALDEIFRAAQARGIHLIVSLESGAALREHSEQHIYFREKGGPLSAVPEFFRDVTAKKLFQNRLTYLAARYGAYRSVLSWELMADIDESWPILKKNPDDLKLKPNEADLCRRARRDIQTWADDMALHMKGMDQHEHLVCVSTALSPGDAWVDLERQEHLDWIFTRGGPPQNSAAGKETPDETAGILQWATAAREPGRAHKPYVLASYGDSKQEKTVQHNAIFAALAAGLAGPPMQLSSESDALAAAARFSEGLSEILRGNGKDELRSVQESIETPSHQKVSMMARVGKRGFAVWLTNSGVQEVKDAEVRLPGLLEGVYQVDWIDTWSGASMRSEKYNAPPKHVDRPLEPVVLRAPAIKRDIALLIVPEK